MSESLSWRLGVEIELVAPLGKSRLDLATAVARDRGGTVRRFFHVQSEPSKVPGAAVFHNLTLGFKVFNPEGAWLASCVDDLTLQSDFQRNAPPKPGWYRILSDDQRLLRLIEQQAHPDQPLTDVLEPVCRLFGTIPTPGPGGMIKVNDVTGASVAIAAPLPGERERPCELVTAPMESDHLRKLESFLALARSLGFTAPVEGATHLHFDATSMQSAHTLANLVEILSFYGDVIKEMLETNPRCSRLGTWPPTLLEAVRAPDFRTLTWDGVRKHLQDVELTKFCDFNLVNCLRPLSPQNTIEIRVLPTHLHGEPIVRAASLMVAIFDRATSAEFITLDSLEGPPPSRTSFLEMLALAPEQEASWFFRSFSERSSNLSR